MFIPSKFRITDQNEILRFLNEHLFGTLVINGFGLVPDVVHVPFNCDFKNESNCLVFHVDNNNPIIQSIQQSGVGKMIVLGAHGYISSSVYGHINAPTYNYQSVHISGKISKLNEDELYLHLSDLVRDFEKGREHKLTMDYWSKDFMDANLKLITGYKLFLDDIECAYKLSQNRNDQDYKHIINDLESRVEGIELANEMRKIKYK